MDSVWDGISSGANVFPVLLIRVTVDDTVDVNASMSQGLFW